MAPFLVQSLENPYDAIMYITSRSSRRLPGSEDYEYDCLRAPEDNPLAKKRAVAIRIGQLEDEEPCTVAETLIGNDAEFSARSVWSSSQAGNRSNCRN